MHFDPARRREMFHQRENGGMFNRRRDDLVATALGIKRRENGGIVGFGAARREHDLVVEGGAEQGLQVLACLLYRACDFTTESVGRGGISELLGEKRQHR